MKKWRKYVPFVVSGVLIIILVGYAPWGQVGDAFEDYSPAAISILIWLSLLYYLLKTLRFYYLLKAMGIDQPLGRVAASYMSAQPVSLLPAGEIYRSNQLQRYTGVPVKDSIPQFTMQGILEGVSMASLALMSALALNTLRLPFLGLTVLLAAAALAIKRGHIVQLTKLVNKLPFVDLTHGTIEQLSHRHQAVLSRRTLPLLMAFSFAIELVGAAIAYYAVVGIGGHINFYQAILLYVIPVIIGFVSFLPGGIGLSEHSAVGVLLLSGLPIAKAVGATLIMRVAIVALGVVYGTLVMLASRNLQLKPANSS